MRRAVAIASLLVLGLAGCERIPEPSPSPAPTAPTPSTTPHGSIARCHRDQIVVSPRWGAALGSYGGTWTFFNVGATPCAFRSAATAEIRNRNGRVLVRSSLGGDSGDEVILPAGSTATAIVLWSNLCRQDAYVLRVRLPDGGGSLDVVTPGGPGCMDASVPSSLSVEAFTSGAATPPEARAITVHEYPGPLAVHEHGVWVTGQEHLVRLDLEGRLEWQFELGRADGALIGGGSDVAMGEGWVFVTCACGSEPDPRFGATTGGVVKIDPHGNRVAAVRIFEDRTPGQVIVSSGAVWVNTGDGITRLALDDLRTEATIRLLSVFLAPGAGRIWAVTGDDTEPLLVKLDPRTNRVVARWRLPEAPSGVVEAFGSVWVSTTGGAQLLRIDPDNGRLIGRAINLFSSAEGLAAGGGSLWVTSNAERSVRRIDPSTGDVVATYELSSDASYVAAGAGMAWVTSYTDWTVTRLSI